MTLNHDYGTPAEGTTDWHVPLNENFASIDADVEVRDTEDALSQYAPNEGAKFFAVDTGRRYLGNGTDWVDIPSHSPSETTLPRETEDPADAPVGALWYRTDVDEVRARLDSGVVTLAGGPAPKTNDAKTHVTFDGDAWRSAFTGIKDDHNDTVSAPSQSGRALRVQLYEGERTGANMHFRFADNWSRRPDTVHARYWLYLGENWGLGTHDKPWDVNGGKLPGFADLTHGSAHGGGSVDDSWSTRGSFRPPKSGGDTRLGWYSYLPGKDGGYGSSDDWNENGEIRFGQWYRIDQYVEVNDVGSSNGVLRAWVDGKLAYEDTSVRFRTMDSVAVGEWWLDVFMGGGWTPGNDMALYIDDVQLWENQQL
ncbi:hypothetical protein SAMN04488063_2806 [Halopelagius inordinatus]|uniref:Polysaccharide lyase 14 domain-containing protein n=1 Tax=Halopelagius inordinatus TaxID=553467 RepID=A0A1I2U6V3_9EURY|nr:hypothetical protein [Halopelagius inordinatus]SFG72864.1 hypothetical protein SAMN04488063_2806 [Halopelagius inordinatus]